MSSETHRFGNIGYTGSMDNDFEGVEKPDIEPEDRRYIERLSEVSVDGCEHGIAVVDGISHEFTSNLPDQVDIPPEITKLLDAEGKKDVKLYHNHPNGTAPSAKDLELLTLKRVNEITVVGSNGNVHVIVNDGGISLLINEYKAFVDVLAQEIDSMLYGEITPGDMTIEMGNYIFAKEQAHRIAMHFGWEYTGGKIDEIF